MEVMKEQILPRSLKDFECQAQEWGLYLVGNGSHGRLEGRE